MSDQFRPRSVGVFSRQEIFGDGLYKVIFLRGLRSAFPGATLTWMTTLDTVFARSLSSVAGPPLLDQVVEFCGIGKKPLELLKPRPRGLGPFDLIIDTQSVLVPTIQLWRIPHRRFVSATFHRRGLDGAPHGVHILDRLFGLLELAAGHRVERDLSPLPLPAPLVAAAEAALPGPASGRIALAPGAGGENKIWPLDRFIALAQSQAARGRQAVFLLGPKEAPWRERIGAEAPGALFPEEHPAFAAAVEAGSAQPLRAVAVAARCAAGVANDAGPGHMIAGSGTPLLSLFGPSSPEKFRPICTRSMMVRAQDFGGPEMTRIPVEAVQDALEALILSASR
ncbi:glycosyltransferase family 9 protein [Falsiroseomonas sp. HW251]|uniref:glycosyltransferase family 9 protein n=1 Tax=Falsiroseomonas sp. HW251 TaxID=3390998 RepID=UPI003D322E86